MNSLQMIQNFIKTEGLQKASATALKPGQLLYGRVEKFFPNNTAIVQIGSMKLLAQFKASLSIEENYLFEVQSNGENGIQLKVLTGNGGQSAGALGQLQLQETKINAKLLQVFIENNIPFTKEQLKSAAEWIPNQLDTKELTALEWMAKKDLPFTKQIFQSLVAVQDTRPFSTQLESLATFLEDPALSSFQTIQPLKQMISSILPETADDVFHNGTEVKQMIQTIIRSLGLEYEKEAGLMSSDKNSSSEALHSLKPLLLNAIAELGSNGKEIVPILNRLTGMQLIAQDPTGPMQQMVLQLPISFGNKNSDVIMQWSGRKNSEGQMDPDYCRILFYLDLQHINQTIIDMKVQNKVIHVTIMNDLKEIDSLVREWTPDLKQKLEAIGYHLSFIKVNPSGENVTVEKLQAHPALFPSKVYHGVDIKI